MVIYTTPAARALKRPIAAKFTTSAQDAGFILEGEQQPSKPKYNPNQQQFDVFARNEMHKKPSIAEG